MKSLLFRTTSVLQNLNGNDATSMKEKKALIRISAFPKPLQSHEPELLIFPGVAYGSIIETKIGNVLMSPLAIKAFWTDKITFQILRMIWYWDKMRIASMI